MKVNLVFLDVEGARDAFGSLRFIFDMQGSTVDDLIAEMMKRYGSKSQRVFLKDGHYKGNTQIIVNWKSMFSRRT